MQPHDYDRRTRTAAETEKHEWEKALKQDEANLTKMEHHLAQLKKDEAVENLSIQGAESVINGLKATIENKKRLISKL